MLSKGEIRLAKIISIVNQKGGVGKTTTAVNLAASLGAIGYKTLLIDIDPQGNSTSGVGINKREVKNSSYDIIIGNASTDETIIKTEFKNLFLIASNIFSKILSLLSGSKTLIISSKLLFLICMFSASNL